MKARHAALAGALAGRFDDHHGELARMLPDQIDALTARVGQLTCRIEELIAAIPAARGRRCRGCRPCQETVNRRESTRPDGKPPSRRYVTLDQAAHDC